MPDMMLGMDTGFPQFTGQEPLSRKVGMMYDYLVQLQESLRYTMQNLDSRNFNAAGLLRIGETIREPLQAKVTNLEGDSMLLWLTADELATELSDTEGRVSTLSQKVDSFTLSVSNGETSSTIALMSNGAQISSQEIKLTGLVSFSDLAGDGTTEINGSNITTGKISAIDMESCTWISRGTDRCAVKIVDNAISFLLQEGGKDMVAAQLYMTDAGIFCFNTLSGYEMRQSSTGRMKLTAKTNMSLDTETGSIYIGTSEDHPSDVTIGRNVAGAEVRLYGAVYVNDVKIS